MIIFRFTNRFISYTLPYMAKNINVRLSDSEEKSLETVKKRLEGITSLVLTYSQVLRRIISDAAKNGERK